METRLSQVQLDEFAEQGFLVLPAVFNDDEVGRMRAEADYILELIINSSIHNERRSRRLDIRQRDGTWTVRKIQPINDLSAYLAAVSEDPRLLDPMRQLMDDEPILMEEKLNYKQPLPAPPPNMTAREADDRFPVHSDWAYYRARTIRRTSCPRPSRWTHARPTAVRFGCGPVPTRSIWSTTRWTTACRSGPSWWTSTAARTSWPRPVPCFCSMRCSFTTRWRTPPVGRGAS